MPILDMRTPLAHGGESLHGDIIHPLRNYTSALNNMPEPFVKRDSTLQELGPRVRRAPQLAQFLLVLEKIGQFARKQFHELLRRHRCAVGMPGQ
jgi:hypothetical protein